MPRSTIAVAGSLAGLTTGLAVLSRRPPDLAMLFHVADLAEAAFGRLVESADLPPGFARDAYFTGLLLGHVLRRFHTSEPSTRDRIARLGRSTVRMLERIDRFVGDRERAMAARLFDVGPPLETPRFRAQA